MPNLSERERLEQSAAFLRQRAPEQPAVAVILGSGLGAFAERLPGHTVVDVSDVPHYPRSTVEGHRGRIVFASAGPLPVMLFQGRVHYYESASVPVVLYPVHVAHLLGVATLIVTNAAGGIRREFDPGDLMLITDQINLSFNRPESPFVPPLAWRAPRFDPELIATAERSAREHGLELRRGVYAGVLGPSYETAAEIAMLGRAGADAVGMSTVLETTLATTLGMRLLGLSLITNRATGIGSTPLSHAEVTAAGERARDAFERLVMGVLSALK